MHKLKCLAPGWVYSLADYRQIFDLSDADLARRILDFPGGISSFNAEMFQAQRTVVSGDTAYDLSQDEMRAYQAAVVEQNIAHLEAHRDALVESTQAGLDEIVALWQRTADTFLQDYAAGLAAGRYQYMTLPDLPVETHRFELALCSDALFHTETTKGYSAQTLIDALLRVAHEVRVFPLLTESGQMSEEIGPVMLQCQQNNFGIEVREVTYQQRKGGNAMLRIWAKECAVE